MTFNNIKKRAQYLNNAPAPAPAGPSGAAAAGKSRDQRLEEARRQLDDVLREVESELAGLSLDLPGSPLAATAARRRD